MLAENVLVKFIHNCTIIGSVNNFFITIQQIRLFIQCAILYISNCLLLWCFESITLIHELMDEVMKIKPVDSLNAIVIQIVLFMDY